MAKDLFPSLTTQSSTDAPVEDDAKTTPVATPDPEPVAEAVYEDEPEAEEVQVTELDMLKDRAKLMGITYSNNIGVEALKQKIQDKLEGVQEASQTAAAAAIVEGSTPTPPVRQRSLRSILRDEALKLVRLRIVNLDPNDADLPGQLYSVSNEFIGTVQKFIPFGEVTDKGYHVPHCLYTLLKDAKFLQIRTVKKQGKEHVEYNYVRKFALEVLEPLTENEIETLKAAQLASGAID